MAAGDTNVASGATDVTAAERALHGAERHLGTGRWED